MIQITDKISHYISVPRIAADPSGQSSHQVLCPSYEHAVAAKNIAIWAAASRWKHKSTMELIQGIKAIRLLLSCSLLDAKLIVDEAKELTKPYDFKYDDEGA